jgi:SAM-dependent methyltransferase
MHDTAYAIGGLLLRTYARPGCTIIELGAMNVNGTLRDACPETATYIGLDIEAGAGVDIVIQPHAPLPISSEVADIVIASSVFEHDMYFWETFLEMVRIAKPQGVLYINTPSNGAYHRYPSDNWRFYPDCGKVLENWARRNRYPLTLLESFIAERQGDVWNDFVAIFVKGTPQDENKNRLLYKRIFCSNVWRFDQTEVLFKREASEDMILIKQLQERLESLRALLDRFF